MNSTYKFTLKEGPKLQMKKKLGTKSWRNFLEGPKWKINIFIGTKNIFKYVYVYVFGPYKYINFSF